ncbi:MAG: hypothetical protein M9944_12875 [Rhizobiaceae bacterium]|nr:hypothetical protein [Rhizobiaceae bacterium]
MSDTVTDEDVEKVARALFPDDIADGSDCHDEWGREGQPCSVCAGKNEWWQSRLKTVREALESISGPASDPAKGDA